MRAIINPKIVFMATIILMGVSIYLLLSAYLPECIHNYRIWYSGKYNEITAEESRRVCREVKEYRRSRYLYVLGRQLQKKGVFLYSSLLFFILSLIVLFITCPVEFPILFSVVLLAYLWIGVACRTLQFLMCKCKKPFGWSLMISLAVVPGLVGLAYILLPLLIPDYINSLY